MDSLRLFGIVVHSIALLFVIFIIKSEFNKSHSEKEQRETSKYHKLLHYLSLYCFGLNITVAISHLMAQIPYICLVGSLSAPNGHLRVVPWPCVPSIKHEDGR